MNISERIERVNQLRKQALKDPEFLSAASEHEAEIKHSATEVKSNRKPSEKKRFAEIYGTCER